MDPTRRARRSSILKTRNEGGSSGDAEGIVGWTDNTLSAGNLTGIVRRRVSFSHTNHVKEFEKTNSSTEFSMSSSDDSNQTMHDIHMSLTMLDTTTRTVVPDYDDLTRFETGHDMSFEKENVDSPSHTPSTSSSTHRADVCPPTEGFKKPEISASRSSTRPSLSTTQLPNQTMRDMNMSLTMFDTTTTTRTVVQEFEKTRFGNDMSFEVDNVELAQHTPSNSTSSRRVDVCPPTEMSKSNRTVISASRSSTRPSTTQMPNQTVCGMNMSLTMFDTTTTTRTETTDFEKTRFGAGNDMSFEMENVERTRHTPSSSRRVDVCSPTEAITGPVIRPSLSTTQMPNQTVCGMNMSFSMLDTSTRTTVPDYEKTCLGNGNDMSFEEENVETVPMPSNISRRIDVCPKIEGNAPLQGISASKSSTKSSLSTTTQVPNQTMCGMNMSLTMFDTTTTTRTETTEFEKTRLGTGNDMSFEGDYVERTPLTTSSSSSRRIDVCPTIEANATLQGMEIPACSSSHPRENNITEEKGGNKDKSEGINTKLYFEKPDPQSFRDPFGMGKLKANKRGAQQQQKESTGKLSFGKFGSAKTPKRNKIYHHILSAQQQPPQPQNSVVTPSIVVRIAKPAANEVVVQTLPMPLDLPITKTIREFGLNCSLGMIDSKKYTDASLMTSPAVFNFIKPKDQSPPPIIMDSVSGGTSPISEKTTTTPTHLSPVIETQSHSQLACISTAAVTNDTVQIPARDSASSLSNESIETCNSQTSFSNSKISSTVEEVEKEKGDMQGRAPNINVSKVKENAVNVANDNDVVDNDSPYDKSLFPESMIMFPENSFQPDPVAITDRTRKVCIVEDNDDECAVATSNEEQVNNISIVSENMENEKEEEDVDPEKDDLRKQTETLRSVTFHNSQFVVKSQMFDESSFPPQSDKTRDVIEDESCYFECTLPSPQTTNNRAKSHVFHLENPSLVCVKLMEKLNEYVSTPGLDIFVKWGFLGSALNKLAMLAEHEWEEILRCEKIVHFLGNDYIKAVNVTRKRFNDPHLCTAAQ